MPRSLSVSALGRPAGGGRLTRSEIITVRLDPKLRFAAEIASRSQRRTVSSIVEVAVEAYLAQEQVALSADPDHRVKLMAAVEEIWDVDEADRFVNLAEKSRWLLNLGEQRLWKVIRDYFRTEAPLTKTQRKVLRASYAKFVEVAAGRRPERELEKN